MTTSVENEVESQILNAITTAGVTGVNFYAGERNAQKILPYVYADVEINSEEIEPFTGIFSCSATIRYAVRADTITDQDFDNKFQQVLQAFYTQPNIAEQMTNQSTSVTFYSVNILKVEPIISGATRTWARDISMELKVTSKET
ncbi:MAG: hypothetical protein EBT82_02340 [Micrococcales bacterium]|nr:hypothetical protein [Micrococcales bacterium]NBR54805.1 hypothetical protein [Micrococcales bacterium]